MSKVNDWEPTEENLARLPKGAQHWIKLRMAQVENLTKRIEELSEGPGPSSRVQQFDYVNPPRWLGTDEIRFFLGNSFETYDDMITVKLERSRDGVHELEVSGVGTGHNEMIMAPSRNSGVRFRFVPEVRP